MQLKVGSDDAYFYGHVKAGPEVEAAKVSDNRTLELYKLVQPAISDEVSEWLTAIKS